MATIEKDFLDLMHQNIFIESFASYNSHAEPSFSAGVMYKGRTVNKNKLVIDDEGKEVVSTAHTYVFGSPSISPKDRMTLPNGTQPKIFSVTAFPDEKGDHHEVVYH